MPKTEGDSGETTDHCILRDTQRGFNFGLGLAGVLGLGGGTPDKLFPGEDLSG